MNKELNLLLENLDYQLIEGKIEGVEVSKLVYDSRKIEEGCLFVCIEGANFDGHDFAAEAISKGSRVLVVEKEIPEALGKGAVIIRVEDSRKALAYLSAAWFDHPASKMKIIGITGTKGKTTSTYLIKSILEHGGYRVGLIGTIEVIIGDKHIHAVNTTPESYVLQETFAEMAEKGIEVVVMEVSSQALMLHRTDGFIFDYGVFTNIEPDHIGPNEHKDFEDYLHCKSLLFSQCKVGILNGDDPHFEKILSGHTCQVQTFGRGEKNDLSSKDEELIKKPGELGVLFSLRGALDLEKVEIGTPGGFSVYNGLCAIAVCRNFQVSEQALRTALKETRVKGRAEGIRVSDEFSLMIDYAHNAMALESLLTSLKEYEPERLVCLFGCGGNRSKLRRYEMGEVSGRLADFTILTSDNPRFEDPEAILDDIESAIKKTDGKYIRITDRKEAIAYAIHHGQPGDVIVLAGKGHEDYQEIKGVKYPMDERDLIRDILASDQK
ncbi:MAG: UDP-N-acetylmuramoyl-L-alanyl-D-glutamate--2,6-diaminopimelate ligase [Lachnospiraceae bacterium]|nr:UDP-N-acetylmuramoyl-L-alanyl-D-glutamate--2,6-diaminopimelate ligase [Lachnospiraceae bacterium]